MNYYPEPDCNILDSAKLALDMTNYATEIN